MGYLTSKIIQVHWSLKDSKQLLSTSKSPSQLSQGLDHTIFDPKHQEEVWAIFQMNAQTLPIALQFHLKG